MKKFPTKIHSTQSQSMIEYLLVFAAVTVLILAMTGKDNSFTQKINKALDTAVAGIETMANCACLEIDGNCPETCGNGCCESGETYTTCPDDC